jgi:DNA-binding protein YbaB
MLQDLVLAAVNEAHRRVDEELKQQLSDLTGGLNLPKIPGLF